MKKFILVIVLSLISTITFATPALVPQTFLCNPNVFNTTNGKNYTLTSVKFSPENKILSTDDTIICNYEHTEKKITSTLTSTFTCYKPSISPNWQSLAPALGKQCNSSNPSSCPFVASSCPTE